MGISDESGHARVILQAPDAAVFPDWGRCRVRVKSTAHRTLALRSSRAQLASARDVACAFPQASRDRTQPRDTTQRHKRCSPDTQSVTMMVVMMRGSPRAGSEANYGACFEKQTAHGPNRRLTVGWIMAETQNVCP